MCLIVLYYITEMGIFFSLTTAGDNNMPWSMKETGTLNIRQLLTVFFLKGWGKFLASKISMYSNDSTLNLTESVTVG